MTPRSTLATGCLLLLALFVGGCASHRSCAGQVATPQTAGMRAAGVDTLLAEHALRADQNILAVPLGRTDAMSYHLVQIRNRESPHIHATHDLTVTLLRGDGVLHVGADSVTMHSGDVAVVAHGTPHYFVNQGAEAAAAFVVFAPPYDGKDQVPVEDRLTD